MNKNAMRNYINTSVSSHLLIAPIGLGKTSFVFSLLEVERKLIFVAPLRSIVEEVLERDFTFSIKDFDEFMKAKLGMLVVTPEALLPYDTDYLCLKNTLFVLDEFHLFYEWGDTFREKLRDFLELLYSQSARVLGLTATIDQDHLRKIKLDASLMNREMDIIDLGNMSYKNCPSFEIRESKRDLLLKIICLGLLTRKRSVIFMRTRAEVDELVLKLKKYSLDVIGCVGGESSYFIKAYQRREYQFIVCTKVLSHGVNLGAVDNVFVLYEVPAFEEVQMFGRGGRDGREFAGHSLDSDKKQSMLAKLGLRVLEFLYE